MWAHKNQPFFLDCTICSKMDQLIPPINGELLKSQRGDMTAVVGAQSVPGNDATAWAPARGPGQCIVLYSYHHRDS
jgi:hypothetical protein